MKLVFSHVLHADSQSVQQRNQLPHLLASAHHRLNLYIFGILLLWKKWLRSTVKGKFSMIVRRNTCVSNIKRVVRFILSRELGCAELAIIIIDGTLEHWSDAWGWSSTRYIWLPTWLSLWYYL